MRVCTSACVCMHLCGAPHQRTMEWLSCYDLWPWHAPRQREGRGGGREKKDTVKHAHAHIYTRKKGGITKCATARKTTTDRDLAICLVNFYWDLWAGASKSLYAHTLKWSHSHIHAWLHTVLRCIPSSIPLNLYEFVFHCPSLNPMRMFKTIFIWLWYEWTRQSILSLGWELYLSAFSSFVHEMKSSKVI